MTITKAPAPAKPDDDLPPAFLGIDAAAIAAAEPAQLAEAAAVKAEKAPPQEGKMPRHLAKALKDRDAVEALAKAGPAKPIDPVIKAKADKAARKPTPIGMDKATIQAKADRAEGKAPAKKAKAPEAPKPAAKGKAAPKAKAAGDKPKRGPREEHRRALELAQKGRLPEPPDFNKPTHKGYRNHLAGIVDAVKAKDIKTLKGLKEFWDKKDNSSSKIMLRRYLDHSLIALTAKAK